MSTRVLDAEDLPGVLPGSLLTDRDGLPLTRTWDGDWALWDLSEQRWRLFALEEVTKVGDDGELSFLPLTLHEAVPAPDGEDEWDGIRKLAAEFYPEAIKKWLGELERLAKASHINANSLRPYDEALATSMEFVGTRLKRVLLRIEAEGIQ